MAMRIVLSKVMVGVVVAGALTVASAFSGIASADDSAEGVDILIWQKAPGLSSEAPTDDVAFYYNRIAFKYAATGDSPQ